MMKIKNITIMITFMLIINAVFTIFVSIPNVNADINEEKPYRPDVLLVKFKSGLPSFFSNLKLSMLGGKVTNSLPDGLKIVNVPEQAQNNIKRILNNDRTVEFVEYDYLIAPSFTPDDPRLGSQWYASTVDYYGVWDGGYTQSTPVIVAALDTGVRATHEDLVNMLLMDLALNTADGSTNVTPVMGHGTATAGLLGAETNNAKGIASLPTNSQIIPIRITNQENGWAYISDAAEAIMYAADNGARVVSLSYLMAGSSTIRNAAAYLENHNGLFFIAAGNNNASNPTWQGGGNWPETIVLAATDSSDSRASFSNYGNYIDLAAPGVGLITTGSSSDSSYSWGTGTSFSSPTAASVAAALFSEFPEATPEQVKQALFISAADLGDPGYDIYYGHGRVDAPAAFQALQLILGNESISPQAPNNPLPIDGAINVSLNPTLSVDVYDPDSYSVDVSFYDEFGDLIGIDTGVSSGGQASVVWSGLSYETTYGWYAIADDNGGGVNTSDTWYFSTIEVQPGEYCATSDIPVQNGGIINDYTYTHTLDDQHESITERESGGKPVSRYTYLEHKWTINIPSGYESYVFYLGAYHSPNSENDEFVFAYSTNDIDYYDMVTVTKTTDDDNYQVYILPSTLSGIVYIQVSDTDQTSGNRNKDTIFIDHMFIDAGGTPPPNDVPFEPSDPDPINDATGVSLNPTLSVYVYDPNGDNMDVSFYDESGVLIGTDTVVGSGSRASVVWSGLDITTTYGWYATADDGRGETNTSGTWYFTTTSEQTEGMYVWDISWSVRGKNLFYTVEVKWDSDGDGLAESSDEMLSDATVYVTLTHQTTGNSWNYNGITDANGKVTFSLKKASLGDYEALVNGMSHSVYSYNPELDVDNPDDYTL